MSALLRRPPLRWALTLLVATVAAFALRVSAASTTPSPPAKAAPLQAPAVSGKILYARDRELWLREGTSDRQFTRSGGLAMQPAWSPDGSAIAYVLRRKNSSDLAVMNADGSGTRLLTNDESPVVDNNLWAFSPAWSPDGKQLAYLTDRGRGSSGVIDLAIWGMTLASRQSRQLRDPSPYSGGDADPVWRPGHPNELVYTHYAYADNGTATFSQLILVNTSTQQAVALTPASENAFQPAWSPTGDALTYVRRSTDRDDLAAIQVPAWPDQDLTASGTMLVSGANAQPVWSPNGTQILYIAESSDAGFDLWTVDITTSPSIAATGRPTQITSSQRVDATSRPSWIP